MCSYIDKQKTTKNQYGNTKICIYVNSAWRISIFCVNLEFFTHFLLYRVVKTQSREKLVIFSIRNTLQKFATQTQHDAFQFFASIKVIYIPSTLNIDLLLWQTQMLNYGLNHVLFLSLFKLIPCPMHWIVYMLAYLNFIFEF